MRGIQKTPELACVLDYFHDKRLIAVVPVAIIRSLHVETSPIRSFLRSFSDLRTQATSS